MRNFAEKILAVVLLLFFVFTTPSTAEIKSFKIRNNDIDLIFEEFKFTNTGHISVAISSVSVTSSMPATSNLSRPDISRIGFYLVSQEAIDYPKGEHISCDLDSQFYSVLFTFQNLSGHSSFNTSYDVTHPDWYSLRFTNCNPLSHVTMDVRTELYNTHGTTKDYLSAGQKNIQSFSLIFSLIYVCSLGVWISVCFKNYPYFHWIHLVMGVFLLIKGFNLLCEAKVQHSIMVTGTPLYGWNVLLYTFQCIRTVFFYAVIAVIIDGCYFLNFAFPVTMSLIIVIPLQIFATIALKIKREVLLEDSWDWDILLWVADIFGIVVFLVVFEVAVFSKTSSETKKNHWAKLDQIRLFYIVFFVYNCIDTVCGVAGWEMAA